MRAASSAFCKLGEFLHGVVNEGASRRRSEPSDDMSCLSIPQQGSRPKPRDKLSLHMVRNPRRSNAIHLSIHRDDWNNGWEDAE